MRKLLTFIAFIAVSFTATAKPEDYPPTAFQLAQICHYVMKTNDGNLNHEDIKIASLGRYTAGRLFDEVELVIKAYIKSPEDMTAENWSFFIKDSLAYLRQESQEKTIVESFMIEGCESIILKAILAEQEAKTRAEVILWRASGDTPEQTRMKKGKSEEASFSHGMFSGFLFDGHQKHRQSLMAARSACTYTFLTAFLSYQKWIKAGDAGLYDKIHTDLYDFFEVHKEYPEVYHQDVNVQELFGKVIRWYDDEYQGDRWATLRREFTEIKDLLFGMPKTLQAMTYNHFNVYGITMSMADYELIRSSVTKAKVNREKACSVLNDLIASLSSENKALADVLRTSIADLSQCEVVEEDDLTSMLAVFFPPECAVYGRGETFHPKFELPQKGQIIKLFNYGSPNFSFDNFMNTLMVVTKEKDSHDDNNV